MGDFALQPPAQRHSTAARKAFSSEFAAAVAAIRRLDDRDPSWALKSAAKPTAHAARATPAPPAPPAAPGFDFNGHETTNQLSFVDYGNDGPVAFRPGMEHRRRRDVYTDYAEALFKQRQLFGKG